MKLTYTYVHVHVVTCRDSASSPLLDHSLVAIRGTKFSGLLSHGGGRHRLTGTQKSEERGFQKQWRMGQILDIDSSIRMGRQEDDKTGLIKSNAVKEPVQFQT